jgi:ubiquinone/menaquinone biosynthesis C-methylase UbiE
MTMGVLDAAELRPGHRVLEVGCGAGDTTLYAARRVGPRGLAIGVDDSAQMVELARRRAGEAGLANVGFVHGDARTYRFAPLRFDVVVSCRGLASCAPNLAPALRPGGRLVFVSRDEPDLLRANLRRAGFDQVAAARIEMEDAPVWLVSAAAPE